MSLVLMCGPSRSIPPMGYAFSQQPFLAESAESLDGAQLPCGRLHVAFPATANPREAPK
jgi:hypothetical protein